MKALVLIIEDKLDLAQLFALYLEKEGMEARIAGSAEQAFSILTGERFDLLLLDINLPGMDGFEFLQAFRKNNSTPVIVVSARETDEDIVLGLGIGADEFIVKPTPPRVMVARVRALLRRVQQLDGGQHTILRFGELSLDPEAYLLMRGNDRVPLSGKEADMLIFLAQNAGKTFSSQEIYDAVWGQGFGDISTVGVYVQRLRKKIEDVPQAPRYLETVSGKGYRFGGLLAQGGA